MFFWNRFTNKITVENYYKIFAETPNPSNEPIKSQSSHRVENRQLICFANQLAGFCMMATFGV